MRKYLKGLTLLVILFAVFFLTGCEEAILHDLDEVKANKVKVVLAKANIPSTKEKEAGSWSIKVSGSLVTDALTVIEENRLIKRELENAPPTSTNFLPSKSERVFFMQQQTSWSLEKTLEQIPGVLEARVHLFESKSSPVSLDDEQEKQSASVLIVTDNEKGINIGDLRELISGATGINKAEISIMLSAFGKEKNNETIGIVSAPEVLQDVTVVTESSESSPVLFGLFPLTLKVKAMLGVGLFFLIGSLCLFFNKKDKRGSVQIEKPLKSKISPINPQQKSNQQDDYQNQVLRDGTHGEEIF
jgi:type III secretory pathway lipoprotein EscJ